MAELAVTGHEKAQETKNRLAAQQRQPLSDNEHHSSGRSEPLEFIAPSRSERLVKWSSPQRWSTAPALPSAETGYRPRHTTRKDTLLS